MTAAITREFEITYGTEKFGGSEDFETTGPYRVQRSHEGFSISFGLVARATTEANAVTAFQNLETRLTKRNLRVLVKLGSTTLYDFNPSTNSGFNTRAVVTKVGTEGADTARSRLYDVTLSAELPADDRLRRGAGTR